MNCIYSHSGSVMDNGEVMDAYIYPQTIVYLHSRQKIRILQVTQVFYTRVTHIQLSKSKNEETNTRHDPILTEEITCKYVLLAERHQTAQMGPNGQLHQTCRQATILT